MRKTKQGVSLIVLVITIIVMIILAASVIISLSNNGIITKANEAVNANDLKQVQQMAALAWSEAYIDKMQGEDVDLQKAVEEELTKSGVNLNDYILDVTDSGVTVKERIPVPDDWKASVREITEDGVPIPKGFVKSPHKDEDEKGEGLVIYALRPEEITEGKTKITMAEYETALRDRNQFVWVPVNDFKNDFKRNSHGYKSRSISNELGVDYWEIVIGENNLPSLTLNAESYVSSNTLQEATAMYESVKKYGGFYIGRYEAGAIKNEYDIFSGYVATGDVTVAMQKYPFAAVPWGETMLDEEIEGGAVTLSRELYPESEESKYGVVSTLTYGVQWDRTLAWWKEIYTDASFNLAYSSKYGLYYDTTIETQYINEGAEYAKVYDAKYQSWTPMIERKSKTEEWLATTGAYEKSKVLNIYDMAGNIAEHTMEGYATNKHVARGGSFSGNGDYSYPVRTVSLHGPKDTYYLTGFRPSLYIK